MKSHVTLGLSRRQVAYYASGEPTVRGPPSALRVSSSGCPAIETGWRDFGTPG